MPPLRGFLRLLLAALWFRLRFPFGTSKKQTGDKTVSLPTWWGMLTLQRAAEQTPRLQRLGIYDVEQSLVLADVLGGNMNILNVGANIGYFCVLSAYFSKGSILAVEPEESNFALLQMNTSPWPRIHCVRAAIGNSTGTSTLQLDAEMPGSHSLKEANTRNAGSKQEVPVVTIDSLLAKEGKKVDVMIMDIQGAEMLALEGMQRTLREDPPRYIFLEFWPYGIRNFQKNPEDLWKVLHGAGYTLRHVGRSSLPDPETKWRDLIAACEREKQGKGFCNLLAVRARR